MSLCKADLRERVIKASVEDDKYIQITAGLREREPGKKYEGYQLEYDGILVCQGWLYIPNNAEINKFVMDERQHMPYSGHPGYKNTITAAIK